MLKIERLDGKTFLDIGSGSGLFSLAARSLGARVHSFDYDPQSVACTSELKRRYRAGDNAWIIERGSELDETSSRDLGRSISFILGACCTTPDGCGRPWIT